MAQNWGAFAGGLTKGYISTDEMYQSRERTKAITDEAEIRKQEAERRKTEFGWREEQHRRDVEMQNRLGDVIKAAPWQKNEDGTVDPTDPVNAPVWDGVLAKQIQIHQEYGRLPLDQMKMLDEHKQKAKGEKAQKAYQSFMSSGNLQDLNAAGMGYDFTGATTEVVKQPWGSTTVVKLKNGDTVPMSAIHAVFAPHVAQAMDKATDNARQDAVAQAQIQNLRADNARADAALKAGKDSAKTQDILNVQKAIESRVLKPTVKNPVTGEMTDPDPVYNRVASEAIAERTKDVDLSKKEALNSVASQVTKIASDVKKDLAALDEIVMADARRNKKQGDKAAIAQNRQIVYENYARNGYQIPADTSIKPISNKPLAAVK